MRKHETVKFFAQWLNRELTIPVVEKIPADHVVWISNAPAGHVLICRCKGSDVIAKTIKALKLPDDELKIIDVAAAWGNGNYDKCIRILKRNTNVVGYVARRRRETAAAALPIFRRICEPTNLTADAQGASFRLQEAAV